MMVNINNMLANYENISSKTENDLDVNHLSEVIKASFVTLLLCVIKRLNESPLRAFNRPALSCRYYVDKCLVGELSCWRTEASRVRISSGTEHVNRKGAASTCFHCDKLLGFIFFSPKH